MAFCIHQELPLPEPRNYTRLALVLQIGKPRMLCRVGFAVKLYLFYLLKGDSKVSII